MVQGMGSVVATVTGYHGSERSKLIKLIDGAGANFVGKMSRSTTHLICWEFKGRKYELAKKLGTVVLNHQWLEDCIKEGKRVPERPYTQQSGKEVGLIILSCSVVTETPVVLAERNKSNLRNCLNNVIDLDSDEIENDDWDVDTLLDENLFPGPGGSKTAQRSSKRKLCKEIFKDNSQAKANNRMSSYKPLAHTPRVQSRNDDDDDVTMLMDLPESSRRSRRLIKKNLKVGLAPIDEEQRNRTMANNNDLTSTSSLSNNSSDEKQDIEWNFGRRRKTASSRSSNSDEETNHLNDIVASGDADIHSKRSPNSEYSNEQLNKSVAMDPCTRLSTSGELSCVICLTEFSSTRGVLPCGHRFCFTCIQNWADHVASKRKQSKCPLCNASFVIITKVDDAGCLDQKIYSQTIPNPLSTQDIFIVPEGGASRETEMQLPSVCCYCQNLYPEDLLIFCQLCQTSCIHSYCLDPPLFPWTCITCRDRRLFYHR